MTTREEVSFCGRRKLQNNGRREGVNTNFIREGAGEMLVQILEASRSVHSGWK